MFDQVSIPWSPHLIVCILSHLQLIVFIIDFFFLLLLLHSQMRPDHVESIASFNKTSGESLSSSCQVLPWRRRKGSENAREREKAILIEPLE